MGLYRLEELLRGTRDDVKAGLVAHGIIESLDFLVLTLLDTFRSKDEEDRALFLNLTTDNSAVMERVRDQLLRKGAELSPEALEALFSASSLYERIVWLLRQYCLLLKDQERG